MFRPSVEPVRRPWRLTGPLRSEIARRRTELVAMARQPLVELHALHDPPAPGAQDVAPPHDAVAAPCAGVATVLSILALAQSADPALQLQTAKAALDPDGRLLLFEPYRRPHWAGVAADAGAPLLRRITRLRTNLPIPDLVRQAGFVIASIERVTMPTAISPLRSFCQIVAVLPAAPR